MSEIRGTLLAAPATTGNTDAQFGTHYSFLGIGGYQEFQTIAERDAIPVDEINGRINDDGRSSGRRRFNMLVYVWETRHFYQLYIPDWDQLVTDMQKYNALLNNGYWIDPPFYTPPPASANIIKIPANYLWASPDNMVETFLYNPSFDFNGRFIDNLFLFDTTGLTSGVDNAGQNATPIILINIIDSKVGGYLGSGRVLKRVNGALTTFVPGDIKANRLYYLIPPLDRTIEAYVFLNPFELVKCEWYTPPPPAATTRMIRLPGNLLYGDAVLQTETFFALDDFDFNGQSQGEAFLLDTRGLVTDLDLNAVTNITGNVKITVTDSKAGGRLGTAEIRKRANNQLIRLSPGDLQKDGLYFLIPPADRSVDNGNFNESFELVKWGWTDPEPPVNMLRIHPANLYATPDNLTEILLGSDNFDFNGRLLDNVFLLDTTGLETDLDGNAHANVTADVRMMIFDSKAGGNIGTARINKRVNGELVPLEPGDMSAGQKYYLIPPLDRVLTRGIEFTHPFELVKWDWNTPPPAVDKYYSVNLPTGDTEEFQYVYGYNHNLNKIPSVTVMDGNNKVINKDVEITINPVNFDVTIEFAAFPPSGKVVLN